MKKISAIILSVIMMLSCFSVTAFAAGAPNILVNGKMAAFGTEQPYIDSNAYTQVPLNFVASYLGIKTAYNEQKNIVTLINGSKVLTVTPAIKSGKAYVPLRKVVDGFGGKISWVQARNAIEISNISNPVNTNKTIILATTTSTQDSGLLTYLLPYFTADTGYEVKVVSVGTGKALQMGVDGDADVLLVHAKADELKFMEANDGISRHDVMYNDFILVGPSNDPAKVKQSYSSDILGALKAIDTAKAAFVSRGDDSGTDKLEKKLWNTIGITPSSSYYFSAGSGMGDVLRMTDEKQGYTITDRATYLSMKDKLELDILCEGANDLLNQYGVIVINPDKGNLINVIGAVDFSDWMVSKRGQELIGKFGIDKYGKPLFFANAK